jgi:hypothetical protein
VSGYLKSHLFETDFDGDHVKVRLKPLLFEDFLKLTSMKEEGGALTLFKEIVPKYMEEISGLTDKGGTSITIDEVCNSAYFVQVVSEIGVALLGAATVERPQKPALPSAS